MVNWQLLFGFKVIMRNILEFVARQTNQTRTSIFGAKPTQFATLAYCTDSLTGVSFAIFAV